MASEKPLNIGMIGLSAKGWASVSHVPALAHPSLVRSGITVTALQTSSEASAAASKDLYSKTWPSIKAYHGTDYSSIAQDPDVNVIAVSVKAPDHKAGVDKAIESGKDLFVEYPPGKSLEESEEMRKRVREHGDITRVLVGLQGRQSSVIRKVKKVLEAGKIGKIHSTTVIGHGAPRETRIQQPEISEDKEYMGDKANGASMLTIAGGHHLDNLIYLLGPFASVSGTASIQYPTMSVLSQHTGEVIKTYPSNTPDHYTFSGPLVSGAHASVTWRSSYTSTPGRTQFLWIIDGETGSIKFESDVGGYTPGSMTSMWSPQVTVNGKPLDEYLEVEGIAYSDPQLELEEGEKGMFVEFVRKAWLEYAKTLRGGQGEFATLDDAIEVMRTLDAVERSAAQGGVSINLS